MPTRDARKPTHILAGLRRPAAGLALPLLLSSASALAAPADDCNSAEPARILRGCTAVLETATVPAAKAAALARLGFAHKQRGECAAAVADLTGALTMIGNNAAILVLRGQCHVKMNQPDLALADFEAALKIEPQNAAALAAIGPLRATAAARPDAPPPPAGGTALAGGSYLGLVFQRVTEEIARSVGLTGSRGAMIAGVIPASPAEQAGLQPGDVVLAVDGNPFDFAQAGKIALAPDKQTALTVWRDGKQLSVAVISAHNPDRPRAQVSPYCHIEGGQWSRGQQYDRFVNATSGYTCVFSYSVGGDPADFKLVATGGAGGELRQCGGLCFTYRARTAGRDRIVAVICKPGNKPAGAECVSADGRGVARLVYEIRTELPVWTPAH